jgi:hypothetical protein
MPVLGKDTCESCGQVDIVEFTRGMLLCLDCSSKVMDFPVIENRDYYRERMDIIKNELEWLVKRNDLLNSLEKLGVGNLDIYLQAVTMVEGKNHSQAL